MHFVFRCLDRPDAAEVRRVNRDAHLAHLARVEAQIVAAGPLLSDDGERMIGSLLVIDFADRAAAEAFARADPYARAGLFSSVSITPWKRVYPR